MIINIVVKIIIIYIIFNIFLVSVVMLCNILLPINFYTSNITIKCHSKSMSGNRDLTGTFHQNISSLPGSIASDSRYFQSS